MAASNVLEQGSLTIVGATTNQATGTLWNAAARGVKVVLDTTVIGTGSVTVTIQGIDKGSGKAYTILAGAAVVTNVTNVYTVFPGATAAANVSVNDQIPAQWRITVTANNANAATYTVGWSTLA